MYILQVNFAYRDMTPDKMAALNDGARAKPFLEVPGLLWKIWLNTEGGPKVGGIYCFESRAAAEAYLAGPIVARMRANPDMIDLTTQIYAVTEAPSRVTRAPVPFLAAAAE